MTLLSLLGTNFESANGGEIFHLPFPILLLQDPAQLLLLKFVSELMAARGDQTLPEMQEEEELEEEEEMGVREEVMRRHLPLSQRERKAGCRNFFWKTFTSC